MSDPFWFFPKQQNLGNITPNDPPTTPLPTTTPSVVSSEHPSEKSLDDALSDIEKEMLSDTEVTIQPTDAVDPVAHPSTPVAPASITQPSAHPRLELLKHTLEDIKKNAQKAIDLLSEELASDGTPMGTHDAARFSQLSQLVPGMAIDTTRHIFHPGTAPAHIDNNGDEGNILEGMFDGQGMVGPDGKQYSIPPNYASKSKLVEGDILKLTISHNGSFIYKQIGPIARRRVIGILETDEETHTFVVKGEGQVWRVLTASVTYFKGVPGDEVVILIPRDKSTQWAAVENIIKKF
ncbi:MAG: hypothetical protein Q8P11_01250 [bacterium]|nr:hypothetical protein [bacterium]